ncbi:hypothetical protein [Mycobacterium sp. NPDC050441]|uniref:hypothetical protein n=1 Tax=Mycobacterium sp. NPDC050441 TaxID=3155403 RepID=UPI003403FB64
MRWAGWWLGPLLGVVSAYGLLVLLIPRWLDCRHGTDAAALGIVIQFEIFMTFWIVAALSGVAYAWLYCLRVRWRTPLALAGAVVLAIAAVWIIVSIQEWVLDDTSCAPPWRLRWISP